MEAARLRLEERQAFGGDPETEKAASAGEVGEIHAVGAQEEDERSWPPAPRWRSP